MASKDANLAVIEVPLLPSEVTGHQAILEFSRLLVSEGQEKRKIDRTIDPSKKFTLYEFDDSDEEEWTDDDDEQQSFHEEVRGAIFVMDVG